MQTTYRLKANELTGELIEALKQTYHDREIEIIISEVEDETEHLLSTDANREHLLSAIDDISNNKNLVDVPVESLDT
jgi:antitoxin YefM